MKEKHSGRKRPSPREPDAQSSSLNTCDAWIRPFDESAYLRFLAREQPHDLSSQIKRDGDIDLKLSKLLTAAQIVGPLRTHRFPRQHLREWHWILSETCSHYGRRPDEHDAKKQVYLSSVLLWIDSLTEDMPPLNTDVVVAILVRSAILLAGEWTARISEFLYYLAKETVAPEKRNADPRIVYMLGAIALGGIMMHEMHRSLRSLGPPKIECVFDGYSSAEGPGLWAGISDHVFSQSGLLQSICSDVQRMLDVNSRQSHGPG